MIDSGFLKSSGIPIKKWRNNNKAVLGEAVRFLAAKNKLSVQAVYKYLDSDRDIRVFKGGIYEVKKLEGKQS